MMAINFPAAAFLASLKAPSQIMYCISQDTGAPVVVYKDAQSVQQSINVAPWSAPNQDGSYNGSNQHKDIQQIHVATSSASNQQQSTIRVEAGNQVSFSGVSFTFLLLRSFLLGRNNSNSTNSCLISIQSRLLNPTKLIFLTNASPDSSTNWLHSSSRSSICNS